MTPICIDLDRSRFVNPADITLQLRSTSFLEGETYSGAISVYDGGELITPDSVLITLNDGRDNTIFAGAMAGSGDYSLNVSSFALRTALGVMPLVDSILKAVVVHGENTYPIAPIPSVIHANANPGNLTFSAENAFIYGDNNTISGGNILLTSTNTEIENSTVTISGEANISGGNNTLNDSTVEISAGENFIYTSNNSIADSQNVINGGVNSVLGSSTIYNSGNVSVSGNATVNGGVNSITGGSIGITGGVNSLRGSVSSIQGGTNIFSGSVKVALSFWADAVYTGNYQQELFIADSLLFTGYSIGAVSSGTGPYHRISGNSGEAIMSPLVGSIYQRDNANNVSTVAIFTFNSGQLFKTSGNYSQTITGGNRLGLSIASGLSGIGGLTIGLFGHQQFTS